MMESHRRFLHRNNLIHLVFLAVLAFFVFRLWILTDGFVIYRDLFWELLPGSYYVHYSYFNPYLVSNIYTIDLSSFTRIFVTWPIPLMMYLGLDSSRVELIYFLMGFAVCYISFIYAVRKIFKLVGIAKVPVVAELIAVFFFVVNPYSLQMFIFSFIWVGMGLLAALIALLLYAAFDDGYRVLSKETLFMMVIFTVLLFTEVRFIFYSVLMVALVLGVMLLLVKNRLAHLKKFAPVLLFFIIVAGMMVTLTNDAAAQGPNVAVQSLGAMTRQSIIDFSQGEPWDLTNVIRLQGYFWSTITYAQPSFIDPFLFTVLTYAIPILALSAFFFCRTRNEKIMGTFLLLLVVCGVLLSVGIKEPGTPFADLMLYLASTGIPLADLFVRNLMYPYYSMILLSIAYSLLLAFVLAKILPGLKQRKREKGPAVAWTRKAKDLVLRDWVIAGIVVLIIILTNFQALSGDLGPSVNILDVYIQPNKMAGVIQPTDPPVLLVNDVNYILNNDPDVKVLWLPGITGSGGALAWNVGSTTESDQLTPLHSLGSMDLLNIFTDPPSKTWEAT